MPERRTWPTLLGGFFLSSVLGGIVSTTLDQLSWSTRHRTENIDRFCAASFASGEQITGSLTSEIYLGEDMVYARRQRESAASIAEIHAEYKKAQRKNRQNEHWWRSQMSIYFGTVAEARYDATLNTVRDLESLAEGFVPDSGSENWAADDSSAALSTAVMDSWTARCGAGIYASSRLSP